VAARACQNRQDVKLTNNDEELENWNDDDGVHKDNYVASKAGSDQDL